MHPGVKHGIGWGFTEKNKPFHGKDEALRLLFAVLKGSRDTHTGQFINLWVLRNPPNGVMAFPTIYEEIKKDFRRQYMSI